MAGTIAADTLTHSTAGSLTTDYVVNGSAKAWVNFTGTGTIAVNDSLNIASLTDDGTGIYRVNMGSAFVSVNHSPVGSNINDSSTANRGTVTVAASGSASSTSSVIAFAVYSVSAGNYLDGTDVNVQAHGDLA